MRFWKSWSVKMTTMGLLGGFRSFCRWFQGTGHDHVDCGDGSHWSAGRRILKWLRQEIQAGLREEICTMLRHGAQGVLWCDERCTEKCAGMQCTNRKVFCPTNLETSADMIISVGSCLSVGCRAAVTNQCTSAASYWRHLSQCIDTFAWHCNAKKVHNARIVAMQFMHLCVCVGWEFDAFGWRFTWIEKAFNFTFHF